MYTIFIFTQSETGKLSFLIGIGDYIYETDGYYPPGVPKYIVDNVIDAVSFLESMRDIRDVYTYPGFDAKKKQGEWKDHRGIRLNKQRRLLFRQDKTTDPITIVVAYVDNGHYK